MDLNRQVLLVTALAVLAPAAAGHALRPGALAGTIRTQGVLPGVRTAPRTAAAYAAGLVVAELAVAALAAVSLAGDGTRLAGVALVVSGLGFVAYVARLLARDYAGDCGCTPLTATVTRLSLLPGAALAAAGLALAPDAAFDDVAFADTSGALQTSLALVAAGLLGALVAVLPATALSGDPLVLVPDPAARQEG
jgi:methylamine utilization protein MauE